jgi:hypothetical protein
MAGEERNDELRGIQDEGSGFGLHFGGEDFERLRAETFIYLLFAEGLAGSLFLIFLLSGPFLNLEGELLNQALEFGGAQVLVVFVGFDMLLVIFVIAPADATISMPASRLRVVLHKIEWYHLADLQFRLLHPSLVIFYEVVVLLGLRGRQLEGQRVVPAVVVEGRQDGSVPDAFSAC